MGAVSRSHREHLRELSDVASVPRAGSAALQVARDRIVWHQIIVTRAMCGGRRDPREC